MGLEKRLPAHPTERKQQKDRQEWSLDSVCLVQRFSGPKGLFTSRKLLPVEVRASSVVVLSQVVTVKAVTGTAQARVLALGGRRCAAVLTTRRVGPVRGVWRLLRAAQHLASSSPVRSPPSAASAVPILLYVHAPTHARSCTYGAGLIVRQKHTRLRAVAGTRSKWPIVATSGPVACAPITARTNTRVPLRTAVATKPRSRSTPLLRGRTLAVRVSPRPPCAIPQLGTSP